MAEAGDEAPETKSEEIEGTHSSSNILKNISFFLSSETLFKFLFWLKHSEIVLLTELVTYCTSSSLYSTASVSVYSMQGMIITPRLILMESMNANFNKCFALCREGFH